MFHVDIQFGRCPLNVSFVFNNEKQNKKELVPSKNLNNIKQVLADD